MATFILPSFRDKNPWDGMKPADGLGSVVLVHNVRWFIAVRWVVVAVFILVGLVSILCPGILAVLGLVASPGWTWSMAAVLAAANVIFWILSRRLTEESPARVVMGNIWLQIVADLVAVTILVHLVGSTSTFIAFTYLFHIVLACIFFSPSRSLLVTLLASNLYLLCVCLEILDTRPFAGIAPLFPRHVFGRDLSMVFAVSAVFVWLVVWYLVSTLSSIVRERDRLLESANQRLIASDAEKNLLVLRTTHDLRAPFSGIESSIQVLKSLHWDQLPAAVQDIVNRIEARGKTLSDRIRDILLLGDLRSRTEQVLVQENIDLQGLLKEVTDELEGKAQERHVQLRVSLAPIEVYGVKRHFFILFSNLMGNAISYSREGGDVNVSARRDGAEVRIAVEDRGIGISAEALPRIFDEYFRTKEAAQFNPGSTGLGLSIVKEIARKEALQIHVTSETGQGSVFEVRLPCNRCRFKQEDP